MKSIKEMTEIMLAYERGEKVQHYFQNQWVDITNPAWCWGMHDYRIKPKSKYVPFETADEFLKAQCQHGTTLIENIVSIAYYSSIDCYNNIKLERKSTGMCEKGTFGHIFNCFHFEDGTPCGKEIKNEE